MLLGGSVASSEALRSYPGLARGQAMMVSEEHKKLKQGMLRSVAGALLDPSREAAASKVTYCLPFGAMMTTLTIFLAGTRFTRSDVLPSTSFRHPICQYSWKIRSFCSWVCSHFVWTPSVLSHSTPSQPSG